MDFAYTPQQEALRRDVLQFIKENVTDDVVEEIESQDHPRGGKVRQGNPMAGEFEHR